MPEIAPGVAAPGFSLRSLSGGQTTLDLARGSLPACLVFFKVDCPTSPLAVSAAERLRQAYGGAAARIIGVSQDPAERTGAFLAENAAAFPVLVDDPDLHASEAYGLRAVPTLVLVGADGRVVRVEIGWSRQAYNDVARSLSAMTGHPYVAASEPSDGKPDWKPG